MSTTSRLSEILTRHEGAILADWLKVLRAGHHRRDDLQSEGDQRAACTRLLSVISRALEKNVVNLADPAWDEARATLTELSRTQAVQGFTASATASFALSLKKPIFDILRREIADPQALVDHVWQTTELIDGLALLTTEAFQTSREEVIIRQQQDLLELSTPVVKLWDGILALPVIGTLDSARTQVVMESLLVKIVETGCEVAIIDITGVATVDTLVAQHLIKTVTAARLMGADCIISGIRPQIAQTIVHLGIDLSGIITKSTLADAFRVALSRTGLGVAKRAVAKPAGV